MECPTALYIWGKFDEILKKIIRKDITPEEKFFGMKCSIIKSREHLRNYITFAIRHTINTYWTRPRPIFKIIMLASVQISVLVSYKPMCVLEKVLC